MSQCVNNQIVQTCTHVIIQNAHVPIWRINMAYEKVKYNNEYNKANYAEIKLRVPKDLKPVIEEHRKNLGYDSTNAYIISLIKNDMNI